jgi:hypothetical protein
MDATLLRQQAARCFRLARAITNAADSARLMALGREYESWAGIAALGESAPSPPFDRCFAGRKPSPA